MEVEITHPIFGYAVSYWRILVSYDSWTQNDCSECTRQ